MLNAVVRKTVRTGGIVVVYGASGTGKSTAARHAAELTGLNWVQIKLALRS